MKTYFYFYFFAIIYYNGNAILFLFVLNTRQNCDYIVSPTQQNHDFVKKLCKRKGKRKGVGNTSKIIFLDYFHLIQK